MTAPRLDLGELREDIERAQQLGFDSIHMPIQQADAVLFIAEAAEAYVSMVEQVPDASLGHQGSLSKVMGGYNDLRAALAAVRKEEKGE